MNLLALMEAGQIRREDSTLPVMQNVSLDTAKSVVQWLVLATGAPAEAHYMSFESGPLVITCVPGEKPQVRERNIGD